MGDGDVAKAGVGDVDIGMAGVAVSFRSRTGIILDNGSLNGEELCSK